MRLTHKLGKTIITKRGKSNVSFCLSNKIGGYTLLGNTPTSRYQGAFLMDNLEMYKIIENINLKDAPPVTEIINEFSCVKRKRGSVVEEFFMPYGYEVLVYGLDKPREVELTLDIRKSYANPEFGRTYSIRKSGKNIIIRYNEQKTNFYLVIRADTNSYTKKGQWIQRLYEDDKKRNSPPFEKWVYKALSIKAQKIIFSFSKSKKQALEETEDVFKNLNRLKSHQQIYVNKINTKQHKNPEIRIAKKCATNSLNKLIVNLKRERGVYAGLPWFFQFWSRDELIAIKALHLNKQEKEVKDILLKNLNLIKNGKLPNINKNDKGNADALGWLFRRIEDSFGLFSTKEKSRIKNKLLSSINFINKNRMKKELICNSPLETWMDTEWDGDNRQGSRIEIQALFLNMLKFAYKLTKNKKYLDQEAAIKEKIKVKFWNGKWLADGLNDFTIRPNVFIAAYIYPELLTKQEWTKCFEYVIPKLWLPWGGLASIDKKHPLFCSSSTGEIPQSYHRGDSWFWINNLAALILRRTNQRKFKRYIEKIIQASSTEILTLGAIGHHAELSSASSLQSQGCNAQAWSNAMFIELLEEV